MKPILDKYDIPIIGVGLGYTSIDGFLGAVDWPEEKLFVDVGKNFYKALGLGSGGISTLLDSETMQAKRTASMLGFKGNLKGDGMQFGGTYVIEKGGKILLEFQQKKFGEFPAREKILEVLNLEDEIQNLRPVVAVEKTGCSKKN